MVYPIATLKLENSLCKIFNLVPNIKQVEPEELNFCFTVKHNQQNFYAYGKTLE